MLNEYSLKARIAPVFILLLPILILGVIYTFEFNNILIFPASILLTTALLQFLSNLGRDKGKKIEIKLWKEWGGMPSAQLLSYENNLIDSFTKKDYHNLLVNKFPLPNGETFDFENEAFSTVSDAYRFWSGKLVAHTRDTEKFNLIFVENMNYGFRRNLWGLKPLSQCLLFLLICGNYIFEGFKRGFDNIHSFPIEFFFSEAILLTLLVIWTFTITPNWIKTPAFAYGKKLLESINTLTA